MNEETNELLKAKKFNVKLYPIYKMFAWDLLFYYAISFLFLNQTKGLSASEILFAEAFYPIFKLIFQIPCVSLIDKIGKRKSLIIGNLFVSASILVLIFANGIASLILSNLVMAIGYSIKGLCESTLLSECVPSTEEKEKVFSSVDGKGASFWYFFDAISSIFTGFLFVFNNYLPMVICFFMCLVSTLISFGFKAFEQNSSKKTEKKTESFKKYLLDLKSAFRYIVKSNRLRCLLIFSGLFSAFLTIRTTLCSNLLQDIGLPEQYFGLVFAILGIISSISTKNLYWFHKKFKNRLLTYFSLTISISFIVLGFIGLSNFSFYITFTIIFVILILHYIVKGPYWTMIKRYLNSFSTPFISTKIYSANTFIEGIFTAISSLFASFLLSFTSSSYAFIILGCIFTVIFILLLDYMKTRVGLKPEQYKKSDIEFEKVLH